MPSKGRLPWQLGLPAEGMGHRAGNSDSAVGLYACSPHRTSDILSAELCHAVCFPPQWSSGIDTGSLHSTLALSRRK